MQGAVLWVRFLLSNGLLFSFPRPRRAPVDEIDVVLRYLTVLRSTLLDWGQSFAGVSVPFDSIDLIMMFYQL